MIKNVIINVVGIQTVDKEKDTVELTTEGRFGTNNGKYYLSYEEGQLVDNSNIKTKIFVNSSDSVVLQRKGEITSRMEITKGNRNFGLYSTPVGDIFIGIYGEKIDIDLNENGGSINMVYTIDSDLKLVSHNEVRITVREVKNVSNS